MLITKVQNVNNVDK